MATFRYIVDDVDQAVSFYRDQLGFALDQQYGPAMAILSWDDLQLWVAGPPASASRPMPDGSKPAPGGWSRIVVVARILPERSKIFAEPGSASRTISSKARAAGRSCARTRPAMSWNFSSRDEASC